MQLRLVGGVGKWASLVLTVGAACAAPTRKAVDFESAAPSSAQVSATQATQPEIGKVLAKGVGTTKEQALKDAYRDAVERAVGLYIDAETLVCNDAVIKDEILTHSNAYIETFEVVDESHENGLFKVRILATVKAREMSERIKCVLPVQMVSVGSALRAAHAQASSLEQRDNDGLALLDKALTGLDPIGSILDCTLVSREPYVSPTVAPNATTREVALLFKYEINYERYLNEVLPRLKVVLDQIAVGEPRDFVVSLTPCMQFDVTDALRNPLWSPSSVGRKLTEDSFRCGVVDVKVELADEKLGPGDGQKFENCKFRIVTKVNAAWTAAHVREYELTPALTARLRLWLTDGLDRMRRKGPQFNVLFLGGADEGLYVGYTSPRWRSGKWQPGVGYDLTTWCTFGVRKPRGKGSVTDAGVLAPWLWNPGFKKGVREAYHWSVFDLPTAILPEVKFIKVDGAIDFQE